MEINGREYADFHRRLRYSNLLRFTEDSSVDVYICEGDRNTGHIEGRILEYQVTDEQSSLSVDCEGFVMMMDVGNIIEITYEPDDDKFTLRVQDRVVANRFQPVITPTEVIEYLADQVLDEAERAAKDEHEEMPEWLADLCPPEPPDDDLVAAALEHGDDDEDEEGRFLLIDPLAKYIPEDDEDDIDGDDFGSPRHHCVDDEEGGEVYGRTCP